MFFSPLLTAAVSTVEATPSTTIDFTWLFLKMVIFLVIVIVLALIFLKYGAPRLRKTMGIEGYFEILGRKRLEGRKVLYFVKGPERYFVIGVAEHGISKIAEYKLDEIEGVGGDAQSKK
ncbi:MAG: flagellar biosynthetic protein FliO [Pseudomonadota bacterium]